MRWSIVSFCVLSACAEGAGVQDINAEPGVFVGEVEGSTSRIAVVRGQQDVVAYVCGEGDTMVDHTGWFRGDAAAATLEREGWTLTFDDTGLAGQLTGPNGQDFVHQVVPASGDAGLYEANDSGCRDGGVVWTQGGELQLQGVWCDAQDNVAQITPVGTLRLQDLGIEAFADTAIGERTFWLNPIAVP